MNDTRGSRGDGPLRRAERATGRRRSDRIVGSSAAIQDIVEQAVAASASSLPVCLSGPEGCGKEHIARAIHSWSAAAAGPFLVVSCVGLPEPLRGREIFGCAESTYSSLPEPHDGALSRATDGTLLIDLADRLSSDLMQTLAKALEVGHFQREGDATAQPLRARVLFASRESLAPSLLRGLPHHMLAIPPLAERREDILPLAAHFLAIHAAEAGLEPVGFTPEARAALDTETWAGNVRELGERIGQALRLAGSGAITAEALMLAAPSDEVPSFKDAKRAFERRYVTGLLRRCSGNISRAARLAKKDRKDFYDVIRRTGVDPTEFR
jgi:two-component system response regulator GlrR